MENLILENLNLKECARYLGYGTSIPNENILKIMKKCERQIMKAAIPRFVYRIFDIHSQIDGMELDGTNLILQGISIKEHLVDCNKAILLCATLSDTVDRLIRKTELCDMTEAVIMDAMAAVGVEQLCDKAEEMIKEEYEKRVRECYFTWRFGFGYGDLPLSQEPSALHLLNTEKTIGVSINENFIMFPRKTVACVIGISNKRIARKHCGCISCNMKDTCKYRQRGERCGF